jgi:hypothetical protein
MTQERRLPTKEQILEAAKKCPQAKEALMILFPADFNGDRLYVKELDLVKRIGTLPINPKFLLGHIGNYYIVFNKYSGLQLYNISNASWEEIIEDDFLPSSCWKKVNSITED